MKIRARSVVVVGVLIVSAVLNACASSAAPPVTVTIFAAASLTDAFNDIAQAFEADHPGVTIEFNFAGSQQLRAQLEQGAVADVFVTANDKEMNAAIRAGLVVSGTQQTFARNRLIVIVPRDNPGRISELKDLSQLNLKIVLAAANVPIGDYALTALNKMNAGYGAAFSSTVLANVVSYEDSVKQVVAKVQLGEADAGIVYASDVTPQTAGKLLQIDIPDKYNVVAAYPIAVLKSAPNAALAEAFIDDVLSDRGQALMRKWGFTSD